MYSQLCEQKSYWSIDFRVTFPLLQSLMLFASTFSHCARISIRQTLVVALLAVLNVGPVLVFDPFYTVLAKD